MQFTLTVDGVSSPELRTCGMRRKRREDEELRGKKLFERGRL
jgi:hypothetical protein